MTLLRVDLPEIKVEKKCYANAGSKALPEGLSVPSQDESGKTAEKRDV
jgi:hypothetical protein